MEYRYYSTLRPISIGCYPEPEGNRVLNITNFDQKTYCPIIKREAWGFILYEKPLSEIDRKMYDLDFCPDPDVKEWVERFNAIPTDFLEFSRESISYCDEVTTPKIGDKVIVFATNINGKGTVDDYSDYDGEYFVKMYDTNEVAIVGQSDMVIEYEREMPTYNCIWAFNNENDEGWLREEKNIEEMSRLGFRIFNTPYGFFFGIDEEDRNDYGLLTKDFNNKYWQPLYELRFMEGDENE